MIAAPKHGSRGFGNAAACLAAAVCLSMTQAIPARADYEGAKIHFDSLDADSQRLIGLGLIGTGDFAGLLDQGFTKRFYQALTRFQRREGFAPDGELNDDEAERLKSRSAEFYDPLGLRYYDHPDAASKLFVPRLAFDSETRTPRGMAFERDDKSLSLSFVAYPTEEKTFGQLYESMTGAAKERKVVYRKRSDRYFVSRGSYKGRQYYTWISSTANGSTGFTLSWTPASDDLGSKLAIALANSFVSGDIANTGPDASDLLAGQAQEEAPQNTVGSETSINDQIPAKPDANTASLDEGTNSVEATAAPYRRPENRIPASLGDDDAAGPSEYWHKPLRPRTIEIKGYEFLFTPAGNGNKGRVRGAGYFTRDHTGKYEVLRNDARKFSIKVSIGDDDPAHANAIDAVVEIEDRSATLTGTLGGREIGQLTESVRGDGSTNTPFFIKFSKGSLKWCLPN